MVFISIILSDGIPVETVLPVSVDQPSRSRLLPCIIEPMYFANHLDERSESLEGFKDPAHAVKRYQQELAWAEQWAREGQQPIAIVMEPGKTHAVLLTSRNFWVADGVGF